MSWIKDNVFGGAAKKAANKQTAAFEEAQDITRQATQEARGDVMELFPRARESLLGGFQAAADMYGQTIPAQAQAFQGGNVGAQQAILAGLPQMQNAILGNQVDYSAFQPQTLNFDPSMFQAQIPGFQQAQEEAQAVNPAGLLTGVNQQGAGVNPVFRAGNFLGGGTGGIGDFRTMRR